MFYFIRRVLSVVPVLFVVSVVIFMIIHLTPGNPATTILGEQATVQQIDELTKELGLNEPLHIQYMEWMRDVLRGDLGTSYYMKDSVIGAIFNNLKPTISLTLLSVFISTLFAIPLGIQAAKRRGTIEDQSIMGLSLIGMSIPNFLFALILLLVFGVYLGWLPVAGYKPLSEGIFNHLKYLILPAISLSAVQIALLARMTRSAMLEVLNSGYITTANAKGVKERGIIYKHALRNAFLPILTVIGHTFGGLIAGAIVVETIFNIPGIGQLIINSIERRDYSVIQGIVLFITVTLIFINLVIDILYGLIDPRIRLQDKS